MKTIKKPSERVAERTAERVLNEQKEDMDKKQKNISKDLF